MTAWSSDSISDEALYFEYVLGNITKYSPR